MSEFKKGDRLTAKDLNDLQRAASGPTRVTAGGQASVDNTAGGLHINVASEDAAKRSRSKTVIITKLPVSSDETLTVKVVSYKNIPPVPCKDGIPSTSYLCAIDTTSEEFLVLPDYGKKAVDYADFFWDAAVDGSPNEKTSYLQARREGGYWIVGFPSAGGGETDIALVHQPFAGTNWDVTPSPDFIRIIHMKVNPSYTFGSGLPTHIWAGLGADPIGNSIVQCWPGTKQSHWQYFLSTNSGYPPIPLANAVYLTTKMIKGVEYITPEVAIAASTPNPLLPAGDC